MCVLLSLKKCYACKTPLYAILDLCMATAFCPMESPTANPNTQCPKFGLPHKLQACTNKFKTMESHTSSTEKSNFPNKFASIQMRACSPGLGSHTKSADEFP